RGLASIGSDQFRYFLGVTALQSQHPQAIETCAGHGILPKELKMKVRFDVSKLRIRTCRIDARHNALSPGMRIVRRDAKSVTQWHIHADIPNICQTAVA